MANYHAVPHKGEWANRREGASRVSATFETQALAAAAAREAAMKSHGEAFIHRPNGQIRERNSYGADPYPPQG